MLLGLASEGEVLVGKCGEVFCMVPYAAQGFVGGEIGAFPSGR